MLKKMLITGVVLTIVNKLFKEEKTECQKCGKCDLKCVNDTKIK